MHSAVFSVTRLAVCFTNFGDNKMRSLFDGPHSRSFLKISPFPSSSVSHSGDPSLYLWVFLVSLSKMPKLFGGKNPFDDPFFTQPFGSFLGVNPFDHPFLAHPFDDKVRGRRQVTIEELNPGDDDDDDDGVRTTDSRKKLIPENPIWNSTQGMERSFMYQKVAYGGPEGIYHTCSEGMMTGGDGVFLAEMKEEDKTNDESLHTISKGLRNKGHSMTTKKRSNGERNSMQTLHNLNEDELSGFEEDWKSNAEKYFPGWGSGFNLLEDAGANQNHHGWDGFPQLGFPSWSGWALPSSSADYGDYAGTWVPANENRPKKVVPVNID